MSSSGRRACLPRLSQANEGWYKATDCKGHPCTKDSIDYVIDVEKPRGIRSEQKNYKDVIELRRIGELSYEYHKFDSLGTPETKKVRSRASFNDLDKVAPNRHVKWSEVPIDRLCRCGEPNYALAQRGPKNRMVSTICGEQKSYDVSGVAKRIYGGLTQKFHSMWRSFLAYVVSLIALLREMAKIPKNWLLTQ